MFHRRGDQPGYRDDRSTSTPVNHSIITTHSLDTKTTDPPVHLSITASSLNTAWIQRRQIHQRTCQSQHHHYTQPGYKDNRSTSAPVNHSIITKHSLDTETTDTPAHLSITASSLHTAWIQRRQIHQRNYQSQHHHSLDTETTEPPAHLYYPHSGAVLKVTKDGTY